MTEQTLELAVIAARRDIAGLTPAQLAVFVLVWLALISEPALQLRLSPESQEFINSEIAMISLGLAVAQILWSRWGKGD